MIHPHQLTDTQKKELFICDADPIENVLNIVPGPQLESP